MSDEIVLSGAEEQLHLRRFCPRVTTGSALLLDGGGADAAPLARRLADAGHLVGLLASAVGKSERVRVRDLAAAALRLAQEPGVAEDRVGLVGLGPAAATALLAGCTQRGFAAIAILGGPVIHAELTAERPFQPIEMVHGLDAPLLAVLGAEARAMGAETLLREALASAAKDAEVVALDTPEAELTRDLARPAAADAGAAWDALALFLAERLAD